MMVRLCRPWGSRARDDDTASAPCVPSARSCSMVANRARDLALGGVPLLALLPSAHD